MGGGVSTRKKSPGTEWCKKQTLEVQDWPELGQLLVLALNAQDAASAVGTRTTASVVRMVAEG
jgi:hypothetical protein